MYRRICHRRLRPHTTSRTARSLAGYRTAWGGCSAAGDTRRWHIESL